jgi:hypothetical protein
MNITVFEQQIDWNHDGRPDYSSAFPRRKVPTTERLQWARLSVPSRPMLTKRSFKLALSVGSVSLALRPYPRDLWFAGAAQDGTLLEDGMIDHRTAM